LPGPASITVGAGHLRARLLGLSPGALSADAYCNNTYSFSLSNETGVHSTQGARLPRAGGVARLPWADGPPGKVEAE